MQRGHLIIIGCGVHYRECYHRQLQNRSVEIALAIDLKSQEEPIRQFFANQILQPKQLLFLDETFRNQLSTEEIQTLIDPIIRSMTIDGVLISTEPKARKSYFLWAMKQRFPVFMDKPISAFSSPEQVDLLLQDYQEMIQASERYGVDAVVCCERRGHDGHLLVQDHLQGLIAEIEMPITGINIHFAGGIWNLPHEYPTLENHPFKYGYGILLHSGYHYIDLLSRLLELNHPLFDPSELELSLEVMSSNPADQVAALGKNSYRFFESHKETPDHSTIQEEWKEFGETDVVLIGQVRRLGAVVTNFSMQLLGTSLSSRQSSIREGTIEGRVRQEQITIHLGPFCSVAISGYSFKTLYAGLPKDHFSTTIFQSPLLKGKVPMTVINRKDLCALTADLDPRTTLNSRAKQWQLDEFLQGRDGHSSLQSHQGTVKLLHLIYSKIKSQLQLK